MEATIPRDSAGNYSLPTGYLAVTGQTVEAGQHNPPLEDLAAAMTGSLPRNGSAGVLANFNLGGYKAINAANGTDPGDVVTLAQVQALIAAITGFPTGALIPMTGSAVPQGFLSANGQTVSRTTYSGLWTFAQVSSNLAASEGAKTAGQYGPGDGSTTFSLPAIADYFIRGLIAGRIIGSSQGDDFLSHLHSVSIAAAGDHVHHISLPYSIGGTSGNTSFFAGSRYGDAIVDTGTAGSHVHPATIGSTGGTETRPKNIAYPYIIKT